MPHKVEIADRTFEDLREYCKLNNLKIGQFADKLIREGLMIEMYGDVPFTNYRKPPKEMVEIPAPDKLKEQEDIPPEIQKVINEHFTEMLNDTTPPITVNESTGEVSLNTNQISEPVDYNIPTREETKARMIETMEKVEAEHPQTYITNQEGEKEIQKEMLKQLGVPDKVVSKITRRRLK